MRRKIRLRVHTAITAFQQKVYEAIARVPRGRVTTYRLLAESIGCNSFRAVGQALAHNPFAPRVPCHRVIASNLTPGGFQGRRRGAAIGKKLSLLAKEGVSFEKGKLSDPQRVCRL